MDKCALHERVLCWPTLLSRIGSQLRYDSRGQSRESNDLVGFCPRRWLSGWWRGRRLAVQAELSWSHARQQTPAKGNVSRRPQAYREGPTWARRRVSLRELVASPDAHQIASSSNLRDTLACTTSRFFLSSPPSQHIAFAVVSCINI